MGLLTEITRMTLRGVQFVASRAANVGKESARTQSMSVHDLMKARRMAEHLEPGDRVLDVGCGNGKRLSEMSLYVPDIEPVGIDLVKRRPPAVPDATTPSLHAFDGRTIPEELGDFDVSLVCYVLHHLSRDHAVELLDNVIARTKRRLLILEDSQEEWTLPYRLRNWSHMVEANVGYAEESSDFARNFSTDMFLNHREWREFLGALDRVENVVCHPLGDISQYAHHCLIVVELAPR